MTYDPGTRLRTNIDDFDDDDGIERKIPAGTLGTIHSHQGSFYNIIWDNGGWTRWTEKEIEADATILNC